MSPASHPVRHALREALEADPRLHLLGEALGLSPATRGIDAPGRLHLLPASDGALVGVGVGLALAGSPAVVELPGPAALLGALPQLAEASALLRGEFAGTLVVRVLLAPGEVAPVAACLAHAGLAIGRASDADDAAALLRAALRRPGPTVLFEDLAAGAALGPAPGDGARLLAEGPAASLFTLGDAAPCLAAARQLAEEGVLVDVVDLRWLRPLDAAQVGDRARASGRPVLVGAAAALLGELTALAFLRLEAPPAVAPADPASICAAVRSSLNY